MTAVDRTYRLRRYGFGHRNRERVYVISSGSGPGANFEVWRGLDHLRDFPTHAEAIRWAQSRAAIDKHPNAPHYHLPEPPTTTTRGGTTHA